jgi:hypothetical protein
MPSNRPNLILDEQAFQDLLSAAFTIQEHNARLNEVRPTEPKPQIRSKAEPDSFCHHCGAVKLHQESRCPHCGLDEFRPGERMQRKWASMWLMSQEQSLFPERPAEVPETPREVHESRQEVGATHQEIHEGLRKTDLTAGVERQPFVPSTLDSDFDGFINAAATPEMASETPTTEPIAAETIQQLFVRPSVNGWEARENPATKSESLAESSIWPDPPKEVPAPKNADAGAPAFSFEVSDNSYPTDVSAPEGITAFGDAMVDDASANTGGRAYSTSTSSSSSLRRRLADLRVTLRFHRANLYLGAAILLAACALLWPTGSAPQQASQQATLTPMERILVAIGIAEAPAPEIHSAGDPNINVWVDPHTALYYCPGEDQYGKTPDGRVSTQHDAQMDRFQPAGRAVCE